MKNVLPNRSRQIVLNYPIDISDVNPPGHYVSTAEQTVLSTTAELIDHLFTSFGIFLPMHNKYFNRD